MDHYHETKPPTELKSAVLGREGSRKASATTPCSRFRMLEIGEPIPADAEYQGRPSSPEWVSITECRMAKACIGKPYTPLFVPFRVPCANA